MKRITFLILAVVFGFVQAQSVSWYQRGQKDLWEIQPDVFAFRAMDVLTYPGEIDSSLVDTSIVDTVMYWPERQDRAIEVCFKAGVDDSRKAQLISIIRSDTLFEQEYTVVTKNSGLSWKAQEWYIADDIVMVNFSSPPSDFELNQLLQNYPLEQYYYPPNSLPSGNYTYMFRLIGEATSPQYASLLVEENPSLIKEATPNFSNIRLEPIHATGSLGNGGQATACYSNDSLYLYSWHIDNDGTFQLGFGPNNSHITPLSTADADADICECWDLGYSGSGVKVGIVARGGYDYTHSDWGNNISQGWDCTQNPCTLLTTNSVPMTQMAMGTFLTGLLGAKRGNVAGAAGVAPGAEVVPYKIDQLESVTSWEAIIRSIDQAISDEVDILVLAMWGVVDNVVMENSINNAGFVGRDILGTKYGMVVLGTPGGYFGFGGGVLTTYPASYSNVIGVIGANPNDQLKVSSDLWDENPPFGYGCIAGDMYDFAAPSALITASDITVPFGYNNINDYITMSDHQCYAAPVVSAGIAAMMLEKNPLMFWTDVREELRDGAEQVGGYSYNANGVSVEFGHGRVSCINSMNAIPASEKEATSRILGISMVNPVIDWALIEVSRLNVAQDYNGLIFDLHGNLVKSFRISGGANNVKIDVQDLSAGLYIVSLDGSKSGTWKGKLVKL